MSMHDIMIMVMIIMMIMMMIMMIMIMMSMFLFELFIRSILSHKALQCFSNLYQNIINVKVLLITL